MRDGRLVLECPRCGSEGHGYVHCPLGHHPIAHLLGARFAATCNCGWHGKPRLLLTRARRDARRHERQEFAFTQERRR